MKLVNFTALWATLDATRASRNLMWRDLANQTGLSASAFSRLKAGRGIDVDSYAACCRWLGMPMETFTDQQPPDSASHNSAAELIAVFQRISVPEVYWTPLVNMITALVPHK
jgi:DNA-binding Xre family transcriptional regulator